MTARRLERPIKRRFALMSPVREESDRSATEENIRAELASELREEAQHFVAALSAEVEFLRTQLSKRGISANQSFERIQSLVADLVDHLESIARSQQRPPIEELGLEQALEKFCQQFCDRTSLALAYESHLENAKIDPNRALAAFRVAQDALSHVAKHRRPNFVSVKLSQREGELHLQVEDMGEAQSATSSFDTNAAETSFLQRMEERAARCAGRVQFSRGEGSTRLAMQVPLDAPRSASAA